MKLFKLYPTSENSTVVARNLFINGKPYQVDCWSEHYMANKPHEANWLSLASAHTFTPYNIGEPLIIGNQ